MRENYRSTLEVNFSCRKKITFSPTLVTVAELSYKVCL